MFVNKIAISISAVSFFGVLFPLGFFLVYGELVIEIWIAKDSFIHLKRRPTTIGDSSLDSFLGIFYSIFLISICTLLFIQTYLTWQYYENQEVVSGVFILTFIGCLFFILMLRIIFISVSGVSLSGHVAAPQTAVFGLPDPSCVKDRKAF